VEHFSTNEPVPIGDWDGDGVRDYAAALRGEYWPWEPYFPEIRSGRTDALLWAARAPNSTEAMWVLAGDLDLDGDGRTDIVVARIDRDIPSFRFVLGIANPGRLLYSIPHPERNVQAGTVGDVDGDDGDDFAVWDGRNAVVTHSGKTGAPLYSVSGQRALDSLGSGSIQPCGDADADGRPDFAASSIAYAPNHGVVEVISGQTGTRLFTFRKEAQFPGGYGFGRWVRGGHDVDQDGVDDLIVGNLQVVDPVNGRNGRASVFSLRDGREIVELLPEASLRYGTNFGEIVGMGAAQPGHPFPVIAVGEAGYGPTTTGYPPRQGRIWLMRVLPLGVRPLGEPCAGTLGQAPRIGLTRHDATRTRIHLSNAPPATAATLLVGVSTSAWQGLPLPLSLAGVGLPGCTLYTSVDATLGVVTGTTGNDRGYAFVDVPSDANLNAQWLVLGSTPTSLALSAGLHW
jgi:hypothetical protein